MPICLIECFGEDRIYVETQSVFVEGSSGPIVTRSDPAHRDIYGGPGRTYEQSDAGHLIVSEENTYYNL